MEWSVSVHRWNGCWETHRKGPNVASAKLRKRWVGGSEGVFSEGSALFEVTWAKLRVVGHLSENGKQQVLLMTYICELFFWNKRRLCGWRHVGSIEIWTRGGSSAHFPHTTPDQCSCRAAKPTLFTHTAVQQPLDHKSTLLRKTLHTHPFPKQINCFFLICEITCCICLLAAVLWPGDHLEPVNPPVTGILLSI